MPRARRHLVRPLVATMAAATVLAAGAVPAAADHVQPRDIADACPPDRAGADDRYSDEITDPDAYAFDTQFYAEEWQTMLRAVADAVGGCSKGARAGAAGGAGAPGAGGRP